MGYDPQKRNRRSPRHPGHNYSSAGYYFITICTYQREYLFGEIHHPVMKLNDFGLVAARYWKNIPERYEGTHLDEWIIMPNHIHGIVVIERDNTAKGETAGRENTIQDKHERAIHELPFTSFHSPNSRNRSPFPSSDHSDSSYPKPQTSQEQRRKSRRIMLLPKIIGWYKMNVSKEINRMRGTPGEDVWLRNYYDHIIRNQKALKNVRNYIVKNPIKWNAGNH